MVMSSIALTAALFVWAKYSGTGTAIRAVAGNHPAAKVVGISTQHVIIQATIVGSGLAGLAGFLTSLDRALTPTMGVSAVIAGIVAAIFGGLGNILGALIGGIVIGIAENFSVLVLPAQLKPLCSFLILIVLLMLRPHGILGVRKKESM
jgi:branched-subunit amino acid ABC-type transport system permease component